MSYKKTLKSKIAQAAMEYLITYGWALILIATIASVLFFILGDNPLKEVIFLSSDPDKISVKEGVVSKEIANIKLKNASGGRLQVLQLSGNCQLNGKTPSEGSPVLVIPGSEMVIECSAPKNQIDKVDINYTDYFGFKKWAVIYTNQGYNSDTGINPRENYCGDGVCDAGENCSSCVSDCGACIPTINQIKVLMIYQGTITTYLRLNGVESQFPGWGSVVGAWGTRTTSWMPNRPGGGNWTWDDINNLQLVIGLSGSPGKLTQVYVIVDNVSGTLNLRPNSAGDYTNIEGAQPAGSTHWTLVDDPVGAADNDATYVWTNSGTEKKDAYQLENAS